MNSQTSAHLLIDNFSKELKKEVIDCITKDTYRQKELFLFITNPVRDIDSMLSIFIFFKNNMKKS